MVLRPPVCRNPAATVLAVLLVLAGAAPASADASPDRPSRTDRHGSLGELARELPLTETAAPAVATADPLTADLSICGQDAGLVGEGPGDVTAFARQLNGTWELRTRTIQGLTIDTDSKFWFDLETGEDGRATGTAMLIDYGNLSVLDPRGATRSCPAHATVSALWKVTVAPTRHGTLNLTMNGEYFGSYGDFLDGIHATETAQFYQVGGGYVAGRLVSPAGGQGLPDDVWDRIALVDGALTYLSCEGRFIDRYVKLSDATPRIDGRTLQQAWAERKRNGSMLEPIPVEPYWLEPAMPRGE